ncbi:MAG: biopolymer transporter ExbD [Mucinivorans sp.]
MAKPSPEINAGSMADIAFLLLIFFLVTTSMGTDSGISRILPPYVDKANDQAIDVKERNLLIVKVSGNNAILVGGKRVDLRAVKDMAKEFITNPQQSESLPETEIKDIPQIGAYPVSKGVISLQNDVSTSYEVYLAVQNELTRAYNEVRNDVADRFFNKKYNDIKNDEQKKAINTAIPTQISEADPVDLTGKKK